MSNLNSEEIMKRFTDLLLRNDVNMHGFQLSVSGNTVAAAYYRPFREGQPHRMYSVSKTLTGIAVGMLIEEGRLSPDQRITDFFKDLLPDNPSGYLLRLTLRDMLRMATCYRKTAYREGIDTDWTAPFFTGCPDHEPGTVFSYDTGCSQVLAALVRRISGLEVLDFLEERLFRPLGCQDSRYWLRDPSGCCQGGTGLCMSLRDLHRIAECLLRGGDGLVPRWYAEEMGKKHIDTSLQDKKEEQYGYGWQCWLTRAGWAMYGMGGQLSVICPDRQAVFSTIADTRLDPSGVQQIYDAFFGEIYPWLQDMDPDHPVFLDLPAVFLQDSGRFRASGEGRYLFSGNNTLGLCAVELEPSALTFIRKDSVAVLRFSRGKALETAWPGQPDVPAVVSASWISEGTLRLRCHAIGDAPCGFDMLVSIRGRCITLKSRCSADPLTREYDGVASGVRQEE